MKKLIIIIVASFILQNNIHATSDLKQEIINRCRAQMSDYGASIVKTCVDEDYKAALRIRNLPEKYNSIINRCRNQMLDYGYSIVLTCINEDIKAAQALDDY